MLPKNADFQFITTVGEPISRSKRAEVGRTVQASHLTRSDVVCDGYKHIPTHREMFPYDLECSRPLATAPNSFCDRFLWIPLDFPVRSVIGAL